VSDGDDQHPSRRYWKAAISALPTAEKRDAAWEFYLERFAGDRAADTLSGLILLLEANGAFLLTLPEKFHAEMTRPVAEQLGALRAELHDNAERQRASLRAADAANEELEKANKWLAGAGDELAAKLNAAARQIDVAALACQVRQQLETSTIAPLRLALRDLPEQSRRIAAATSAAESSVQAWRQVHLGGIILNSSLAVLLVGALLFGLAWIRLQRRFDERLAAEMDRITGIQESFAEAALLDVPFHLRRWSDQDGKVVPGGYAITVDHAEDAAILPGDGGKRGVIFFKAQRPADKIEELRRMVEDLRKIRGR
jgi:hypothetical protein